MIAIAHRGKVVLERAFGSANLATGEALTPRHRFRVASHSKSFTAAGILKLREQGRLKLDDAAGQYVDGLHPAVARATIAQLLSHTAGLIRDGADAGQFRRPAAVSQRRASCRADLKRPLDHRAQHALQIFQPRLRAARPDHRGDHRRALTPNGSSARSSTPAGLNETAARHAAAARHAVRARPHGPHPARPPRSSSRATTRPTRSMPAGRLRQHGRRHRALFRAALAERAQQRAVGREPARDDAPPVAQSAHEPRALLRPRHDQRHVQRLGLVRPFGRPAGLHLAHLRLSRSRSSPSRC